MKKTYPIIANCNFETRDDERGRAIHAARKAAEAGLTTDADLLAALDALEETLTEHAESQYADGMEACRVAERGVESAWTPAVQHAAEEARQDRYTS
jgi:hypothetical protein